MEVEAHGSLLTMAIWSESLSLNFLIDDPLEYNIESYQSFMLLVKNLLT